jgi:hypothetical protein
VKIMAGAAGMGKWEVAHSDFVWQFSCFADDGAIPELDIKAKPIHICAARMVFSI